MQGKDRSVQNPFVGLKENEKRAFLRSDAYNRMLNRLVAGLTGRYDLTVTLLPRTQDELGFTNNKIIYINPEHELFENEPLDKITVYCLALILHESLHPIYSDFVLFGEAGRKKPTDKEHEPGFRTSIFNVLEDARIERIGAYKFPGIAYALDELRLLMYKHREEETETLSVLWEYIWQYATVGLVKQPLSDEAKAYWKQIKPFVVAARRADRCKDCYDNVLKIVEILKPLISDEKMPENFMPPMPVGNGNAIPQDADTGGADSLAERRQQTDEQEEQDGQGKSQKSDEKANESGKNTQSGNGDDGDDKAKAKSAGSSKDGQKGEDGKESSASDGGGNDAGDDSSNFDDLIQDAVSKALNEAKEDEKAHQNDVEQLKKDSPASLLSVELVKGSHSKFTQYNILRQKCVPVINQMTTRLKRILNYNQDELQRYLTKGNVDGKSLSRVLTGNICAKRVEKDDEADLNIIVLADSSGSMSGDREHNLKLATIVFQEVCQNLKIPISVIGFSGRKITHYLNYKQKNRYANYNIASLVSSGGTPLGEALDYIDGYLNSVREEDKLVIVITDGIPNDSELAKTNIKKLRKKALVYGLAIGEGQNVLQNIFQKEYISIDRLEQLPQEMCKVVQKNLIRR